MLKETSPILDPNTSISNILNRRKKNLRHFTQKWVRNSNIIIIIIIIIIIVIMMMIIIIIIE